MLMGVFLAGISYYHCNSVVLHFFSIPGFKYMLVTEFQCDYSFHSVFQTQDYKQTGIWIKPFSKERLIINMCSCKWILWTWLSKTSLQQALILWKLWFLLYVTLISFMYFWGLKILWSIKFWNKIPVSVRLICLMA